ncbi:unnamed protein product [Closterium sp. NIES-65]|nr:unnamed protein product [Closterium sp. NIES-65]
MERSPRHPAFRADRVPVVRDGRVADARTNDEGHAERADRDAWLQESGRGPGAEGGNHPGGRVFRSPEERGRRRDERGRWLAFGEQSRGQGGSGGSVARGENSPHNAVREETPEQGVEDKEEGSERSDVEAGIKGANEARTGGTSDAETEPAEAQAETSPVAVAELEAPPPGSRGRDDPYEEGRRTESSGRQELGGPEMSHRAWQAPNSRGKGKEERSRLAERERRLGGGCVGEFRPRGEHQEQGEWSGGASHLAGRQQPRGERGRETETAPPKWHGQQQGGRSSTIRSPGRTRQRERRDSSWSRSPDGQHTRREKYAGEWSPWRQPRTWSEHLDAWSPSPERRPRREMSRWEGQEVHGPPTVQWGRTEGRGESMEWYEAGGGRQKRRTEGGTLAQGAERAREAREGMQRARVGGTERSRQEGASEAWGEGRGGSNGAPRILEKGGAARRTASAIREGGAEESIPGHGGAATRGAGRAAGEGRSA